MTGGIIVSRINSTLVLTCRSSGGRPLPTISWQSSGHRLLQGNQVRTVILSIREAFKKKKFVTGGVGPRVFVTNKKKKPK